METSTSALPLLNKTICCNTDSIEMKELVAFLREPYEIEKLKTQVKEYQDEFLCLPICFNFLKKHYEQLVKDNDVLTRDVRQSSNCSKQLKGEKQLTEANERASECLCVLLQALADINSDRVDTADSYKLYSVPEKAFPQEIHK